MGIRIYNHSSGHSGPPETIKRRMSEYQSDKVNKGLREGTIGPKLQVYADILDRGLEKLPSPEKPETLLRVVNAYDILKKNYQKGKIITWPAFSSCFPSNGISDAKKFAKMYNESDLRKQTADGLLYEEVEGFLTVLQDHEEVEGIPCSDAFW